MVKKKFTKYEWEEIAIKKFGPDRDNWRFVCPCHGIVQSKKIFSSYDHVGQDLLPYHDCLSNWIMKNNKKGRNTVEIDLVIEIMQQPKDEIVVEYRGVSFSVFDFADN